MIRRALIVLTLSALGLFAVSGLALAGNPIDGATYFNDESITITEGSPNSRT